MSSASLRDERVVWVQLLARRIKARVPHEVLDNDDVATFFEETWGASVADFVERTLARMREQGGSSSSPRSSPRAGF